MRFQKIFLEIEYYIVLLINIGKEYEKLNCLQYFDLPQLDERQKEKEIFIDGGCFDGSTSLGFINWCKKIIGGGISTRGNLI